MADVIVVLGARALSGGRPSRAMRRRVDHAVALLDDGVADRLLMSGGRIGGLPPEAEIMRDLAIEAGVPAARIEIEPDSRSTLENAIFTTRILDARGWSHPLIVTDWLHVPRAALAFRSQGVHLATSAVTRGWRDEPASRWLYYLAREAVALVGYTVLIMAGRHRR
jgi:uncharacterized SAM-binding protein YcdF (DUF218 family)